MVVNHDFITYIDFTHIADSQLQTQQVMT